MVTRRGAEAAVLVPADEWWRQQAAARPTLKEALLAEHTPADIPLPPRGQARRRQPAAFG